MRKTVVVLAALLVVSPLLAFAQSTSDVQSEINALLAEIQELEQQILALGGAVASSSLLTTTSIGTPTDVGSSSGSCTPISGSLSVGSTGSDVTSLQYFLESLGLMSTSTGFFGTATQSALQEWQSQEGIVSSGSASTTGWGVFGPQTMAAYNQQCEGRSGASILGATPTSGAAPLTVTFDDFSGMQSDWIAFGDGSTSTGWTTSSSTIISLTHTYQNNGTYVANLYRGSGSSFSLDCPTGDSACEGLVQLANGSSGIPIDSIMITVGAATSTDSNTGSNTGIDDGGSGTTTTTPGGSGTCSVGSILGNGGCISLSDTGQTSTNGNGNGSSENASTTSVTRNGITTTDYSGIMGPINPCGNSHSYGPAWGDCQECPNGTIATPDGSSCVPECPVGSSGTPPNCTNECGLPLPICPSGFVNTGGLCGQLCERTAGYIAGDPELIVNGPFYGTPPLMVSLYDDGAYGTVTFNFGDGSTPYSTAVVCNGTCSYPSINHTYQTPGNYTVTLTGELTQGGPVVLVGTASIVVFNPASLQTCPTGTQGIFPVCYGGSPQAPSLQINIGGAGCSAGLNAIGEGCGTAAAPTVSFTVNGQSNVTLAPGTTFQAQYSSSNVIGCAGTTLIGSTSYPLSSFGANDTGYLNGASPTTGSETYVISCSGANGETVSATTTITSSSAASSAGDNASQLASASLVAPLSQIASALAALESALNSLISK